MTEYNTILLPVSLVEMVTNPTNSVFFTICIKTFMDFLAVLKGLEIIFMSNAPLPKACD
jgi:hypothetical protein